MNHATTTDVTVDWGGLDVRDVYPQRLPDLFVGRPIIATGRFRGSSPTTIQVVGKAAGEELAVALPAEPGNPSESHTGLPAVWARHKIADRAYRSVTEPDGDWSAVIRNVALEYGLSGRVPDLPFQMLTSLALEKGAWNEMARRAPWQMTRMNLNTFARHGVFDKRDRVKMIADRLRDRAAIAKARVFPYQLLAAYLSTGDDIPREIREALQDAMEIAIDNVPRIDGKVYVFPDISGSMHSPVTGHRKGSSSKVRCVDVAALVAASVLRRNGDAEVLPFESDVVKVRLNPRDSVMTNAQKLASLPCGGTNCSRRCDC